MDNQEEVLEFYFEAWGWQYSVVIMAAIVAAALYCGVLLLPFHFARSPAT